MKYSMAGLFLALPLSALAAEPVAQVAAAAPVVSSGIGGQLTQLVLGLLLVVGLIFVLAWLMRRVQRIGPGNAQVIEMIGSRALGPRDRLVLVQVGEEQILLGITPGRITPLHVLKTPVEATRTETSTPEFAQRLMELLGKDQKDKK
ncbi:MULTISPECIES: flagellar biosynthetic protein FliO [unclassified Pseudomonas]|uniref:flagellar biosynthetic protein FliO n=1 Tax=unclassified Pseudomonas TaxID=196821 RepID=UPI001F44D88C|nr:MULTISPECIES: flagellar biosynthetic protein FliO [unclassified Pseudomonas]MCF5229693.1 flagellar biosynthetic protein FliO [Pseudomonas sp. PA-5-4H]MCF5238946.1 flagellar biosynthetic protein FliO [Pseudomonas sp. PA-5-4G]MCF5250207.1 flagellar biosynthetic protein FliO [Pseudomonas sp. PA-5-4B]MCF5253046.1 flagellar biosynthetic protein FliO [Pseudomonas sp. PA-5-4B]MCF5259080.1 flagellar biosynthetic protein FliO [Pseudomonas sp. PA-5-4A]